MYNGLNYFNQFQYPDEITQIDGYQFFCCTIYQYSKRIVRINNQQHYVAVSWAKWVFNTYAADDITNQQLRDACIVLTLIAIVCWLSALETMISINPWIISCCLNISRRDLAKIGIFKSTTWMSWKPRHIEFA